MNNCKPRKIRNKTKMKNNKILKIFTKNFKISMNFQKKRNNRVY